jgi:hypothetical protein
MAGFFFPCYYLPFPGAMANVKPTGPTLRLPKPIHKPGNPQRSHLSVTHPGPKGATLWAPSLLWGRSLFRLTFSAHFVLSLLNF